jgi:hypothetical protein
MAALTLVEGCMARRHEAWGAAEGEQIPMAVVAVCMHSMAVAAHTDLAQMPGSLRLVMTSAAALSAEAEESA